MINVGQICSVEECSRPAICRTWCTKHYEMWKRHKDVNWKRKRTNPWDRFIIRVNKNGSIPEHVPELGNCHVWTGYVFDRYGEFKINPDKPILAHRASWVLQVGEIPSGMMVCHKCDNKLCVRIDHLFLGTHQDNMSDMVNKNRQAKDSHAAKPERRARGSRMGEAKLNEEKVREIKGYISDGKTDKELAEAYGVSPACIWLIRTGKSWRHII